MNWNDFGLLFPREYLRAALMVSLLSVWLLVGLFCYLNQYAKRRYFTMWMTAWLFYALWLTLSARWQTVDPGTLMFVLRQWCVAISAVFLLWGSLEFLDIRARESLLGLFMLFLIVWSAVSPQILSDKLVIQMPVFILMGLGSIFAGTCFYRQRQEMPFVGSGMLSVGFFLWGLYLASYPVSQEYENLFSAGFFMAAVLQLFIAISMIVLVLEEVRHKNEQILAQIGAVQSEKEALHSKVLTAEQECRQLFDQVRLSKGLQQAYEELRQTQEAVVQQERLRALGQMASGVAHDINNSLTSMIGFSDLLLEMLPDAPENVRQQLQWIRQGGDDIAQIVARMREFYRRRDHNETLDRVDVNQVILDITEITRPRWRDLSQRESIQITIQHQLDPALPKLLSDASELREAFTNMIFNAVDAMPEGGTITFVTKTIQVKDGAIKNGHPSHLVIEIRDNGTGMDETTRQRCLEPFYSTKLKRGGTGLGLAMVYGMAERHEGSIDIESETGRGTCIRMILPLREMERPAKTKMPVRSTNRPLSILCIDDEPLVRQFMKRALTHLNHQVLIADGAKTGLEMFRAAQDQAPFDVVITDLGMPEMDGRQVASVIKQQAPQTSVILLTGWGSIMQEEGDSPSQVDAVLSKPPRIKELKHILASISVPP